MNMQGTEKQKALATLIKAEAVQSIAAAGLLTPHFREKCTALSEAVEAITDSSWIISNRYNLGLKTASFMARSAHDHRSGSLISSVVTQRVLAKSLPAQRNLQLHQGASDCVKSHVSGSMAT
ncbi:hypothetical protein [Pseudomonas sp.]|uniref:hypothetical protein n=1 Tax=Pseudomonas sp. TaxID=306 RepID=UPI0026223D06|nr:hypothetical protein [Pseudomonas sp.]